MKFNIPLDNLIGIPVCNIHRTHQQGVIVSVEEGLLIGVDLGDKDGFIHLIPIQDLGIPSKGRAPFRLVDVNDDITPNDANYYIVWNESETEGFVTTDKQLSYEARKGAESNCFTTEGVKSELAVSFCEIYSSEEDCKIQEVYRG